ncbi:MAG: hypothetical protein HOD26_19850 [Gammaproteobacteria bacterium]|nr:hypothetical protein [Gammaproteobacteria bacterium]
MKSMKSMKSEDSNCGQLESGKRCSLYSPAYWQALKALEPMIDSISHELIDRIEDKGECKFPSEFGLPLPLTVIASQTGH